MKMMENIQSFLGMMAHKVVTDIVLMHCQSELADMWYNNNLSNLRQVICEENIFCSSISIKICPNSKLTMYVF